MRKLLIFVIVIQILVFIEFLAFRCPRLYTYIVNKSSEVLTSGNPTLVKITTKKKTWLNSTYP